VRARARLFRRRLRLTLVLIDVERLGNSSIRFDGERRNGAAAVVHRDRNPAAGIDDDLIRAKTDRSTPD
jgi:hypothetical protein